MAETIEKAETIIKKDRPALSGWPMIIAWLAMVIFALHTSTHMVGAGDTWVAMASGRHFINHGVDTIEPFSANSHKAGPTDESMVKYARQLRRSLATAKAPQGKIKSSLINYWADKAESFPDWPQWKKNFAAKIHPTGWVNQNWLTHIIFYWLTHESPVADAETLSFNSLVYGKALIYILVVACVFYTARVLGVNPALSALFACFAMFVGRSFIDIRPAGFSNLMVIVFFLILAISTYRNILYLWLIVPLTVLWCNLHGGYIYVFIMLIGFLGLHFFTSFFPNKFVSIGKKGIYHTIAVGIVTFIATVIFNPFHLTNFTHTFIISFSEHAEMWRQVNEWKPAFDWANPVGTAIPFLVMYIMAWLAIIIWAAVLLLTKRTLPQPKKRKNSDTDQYQWPKIDIALIAIAALTIYMALRSRRFIPIAGYIACPVIAMFIYQTIRVISATKNFHLKNKLAVSPMPKQLQRSFIVAGALAVVFFGTWWGLKFKRVYLDVWPTDERLNSVFMRMTASNVKPFDAMQFIRENKMSGKMFNYWTEGGFIGYGQDPDPNTGKTPLQLFMDGRAQAAYEHEIYSLWSHIMSGGPGIQSARIRRTAPNYVETGRWVGQQLKKYNVWVVLMPATQFGKAFVRSIERNPDWQLAFLNNKQRLYIDITTPQGRSLFEKSMNGRAKYPNEFTENLMAAHCRFVFGKDEAARQIGLKHALKAFDINPSQAPVLEILTASRFPDLRPNIFKFCNEYLKKFNEKKHIWNNQDGYHHRIAAAWAAAGFMQRNARINNDLENEKIFANQRLQLQNDLSVIEKSKRW